MLQTYKAVIRGDRIEWQGDAPASIKSNQAIPVQITLLEEPTPEPSAPVAVIPNGAKLAALLEQLANINAFADIEDPVEWQREIRKDRPLPGREE